MSDSALSPQDPDVQKITSVGFDRALEGLELLSLEDGVARARLPVSGAVQNPLGTLHGGAIATLVDDIGTLAIMSADAESRPGVTTDLSVSYLRAAPAGAEVTIEGKAAKTGRSLAFVEVELQCEGKVMALGRMTKFMGR